jgi:hypothetical protein
MCCAGGCVPVLVALLIVSPSVRRTVFLLGAPAFVISVGVAWLDLTSLEQACGYQS